LFKMPCVKASPPRHGFDRELYGRNPDRGIYPGSLGLTASVSVLDKNPRTKPVVLTTGGPRHRLTRRGFGCHERHGLALVFAPLPNSFDRMVPARAPVAFQGLIENRTSSIPHPVGQPSRRGVLAPCVWRLM